jgi:TonB family protein
MPFFTVPFLIIGGLIITIVIQSYFNREHPPLKIPEFITDQITVFLIGAISVLFTFLLFFWWAQVNPNTVVNDPPDNLLFFGICVFIFYSFQINYHYRLIKSISVLNLYICSIPFSVFCFYTFNDDGNIVSVVYFIVTISAVFFSQNKILSEYYRQFNSILGFDSFVKFILRIIKHPNRLSTNVTDGSYPFTESNINFDIENSIISANESKEFISKIKNIWQEKGKIIFLNILNKIKSKLNIIIGIIVLIVIINLLYQLINYSKKDVAEPQLKNKNSSSSTIKFPIQIDPPSTSIEVPQRARISASVIANTCERPEYPSASKKLDEEGTVYLKFLIDAEGKVIQSEIERSSGYIRLDEAAINGLSRCKFKPATEDGRPEQAWTSMKFTWRLE